MTKPQVFIFGAIAGILIFICVILLYTNSPAPESNENSTLFLDTGRKKLPSPKEYVKIRISDSMSLPFQSVDSKLEKQTEKVNVIAKQIEKSDTNFVHQIDTLGKTYSELLACYDSLKKFDEQIKNLEKQKKPNEPLFNRHLNSQIMAIQKNKGFYYEKILRIKP